MSNFFEIIKNPAKYIWKDGNSSSPATPKEASPEPKKMSLASAGDKNSSPATFLLGVLKTLNKGKTGIIFKVLLAIILISSLIISFYSPKNTPTVEKPPVEDPGDSLTLPEFKNVNYISASIDLDGKYLLYSPKLNQINKFGVRGILLDSIKASKDFSFYFPIEYVKYSPVIELKYNEPVFDTPKRYLTSLKINPKDGKLILDYLSKNPYEESFNKTAYFYTPNKLVLLENISSYADLENLHKTAEGLLTFTFKNKFYVLDYKEGKVIKEYAIKDSATSQYTYYNGEVYFLRRKTLVDKKDYTYELVKNNKDDKEIYSLFLGKTKPHKFQVLSQNRFMIVYEYPSKRSFFKIEIIDEENNKLLTIFLKEEGDRLLKLNNAYYNDADKNVLLLGNGIAKLFDSSGNQLWMH